MEEAFGISKILS